MTTMTQSALRSGRYVLGGATYVTVSVVDRRTMLVFGKDNQVEITRAVRRDGRWYVSYRLGTEPQDSYLEKVADSS